MTESLVPTRAEPRHDVADPVVAEIVGAIESRAPDTPSRPSPVAGLAFPPPSASSFVEPGPRRHAPGSMLAALRRAGPSATPSVGHHDARADAGIVVDYDELCDASGHISSNEQAEQVYALAHDPARLDGAYADAAAGNQRATTMLGELEGIYAAVGVAVAREVGRIVCTVPVLHELLSCTPNWASISYLRADRPGGQRLRGAIGDAFRAEARSQGLKNAVITNAIAALGALGAPGKLARGAAAADVPAVGELQAEVDELSKAEIKTQAAAENAPQPTFAGADTGSGPAPTAAPASTRTYFGGGGSHFGGRPGMRESPAPRSVEAAPRAGPVTGAAGLQLSETETAMVADAERTVAQLGTPLKVKTKAGAGVGPPLRSGFGKRGSGAELTNQVLEAGREIGHDFEINSSIDEGIPGQAAASHAEKLAAIKHPGRNLAVDRQMCLDCYAFLQKLARNRKLTFVVQEPGQTWVFRADGARVGLTGAARVIIRADGTASAAPTGLPSP